jgi:hypothetical protein
MPRLGWWRRAEKGINKQSGGGHKRVWRRRPARGIPPRRTRSRGSWRLELSRNHVPSWACRQPPRHARTPRRHDLHYLFIYLLLHRGTDCLASCLALPSSFTPTCPAAYVTVTPPPPPATTACYRHDEITDSGAYPAVHVAVPCHPSIQSREIDIQRRENGTDGICSNLGGKSSSVFASLRLRYN